MNNQEIQGEKVSDHLLVAECINNKKRRNNSVPDCCAIVHRGCFTDKNKVTHSVAVKKYQKRESEIISSSTYERVIETLKFLSLPGNKHPNFIRFFEDESRNTAGKELGERAEGPPPSKRKCTTKDEFRYLITELCVCSVGDLVGEKRAKIYKFGGLDLSAQDILNALPHKEMLKQSAEAVNFLHGLGLIHRNLHPDNFLVQQITGENQFKIKLTDFQLTKDWEKDIKISKSFSWSDWIVPEQDKILFKPQDDKTDVFMMGCYIYYVLTGGKHPFGISFDDRRRNIRDAQYGVYKNDPSAWNPSDKLKDSLPDETERMQAIKLLRKMMRFDPSGRISMWQVLEDKWFYPYQEHYNIYDDALSNPSVEKKAGLCVIICQETFKRVIKTSEKEWDPLTGINNDASQLRRTFARFGYDVLLYKNLQSVQMMNSLKPDQLASQLGRENLNHYASLVFCVLSHGDKGVVYGVDCLPVPINHLRNMFSSNNCPAMTGKPKIFIIFACQGNNDQIVVTHTPNEYPDDVEMANKPADVIAYASNNDRHDSPPISDFLFLISSIEDFFSYYIPGVGSPFISHLCGAMMSEYGNNKAENSEEEKDKRDLVNLFTSAVAPRLGRWIIRKSDSITCRQTPELRSSLTKTIRFRAKQPTHVIANQIKEEAALLAQQESDQNPPSALPVKFIY